MANGTIRLPDGREIELTPDVLNSIVPLLGNQAGQAFAAPAGVQRTMAGGPAALDFGAVPSSQGQATPAAEKPWESYARMQSGQSSQPAPAGPKPWEEYAGAGQRIQAPNGDLIEFPAYMSDDAIKSVMQKHYPSSGGSASTPAAKRYEMELDGRRYEVEAAGQGQAGPWTKYGGPGGSPSMPGQGAMGPERPPMSAPAAPVSMPAMDPMGIGTGFEEQVTPVRGGMSYGDQMRNVGDVVGKAGRGVDDLARLAADGATFGGVDHLAGLMSGRGVEAERAMTEASKDRTGGMGLAAEMLGGAAGGIGIGKAGLTALRAVPQKATGLGAELLRMGAQSLDGLAIGALDSRLHGKDAVEGAQQGALWGMGGALAGRAIGGAAHAMGSLANRPGPVPDRMGIKQAASAAYKRADDADVVFRPENIAALGDDIKGTLGKFGYHPELQPGVATLVREVDRLAGQNVTAKGLSQLRTMATNLSADGNASERKIAGMLREKIDGLYSKLGPDDVLSGDPRLAGEALGEGNDLWRRQKAMEKVQKAMDKAERNASGPGGDASRQQEAQIRSILNSDKARRGFKSEELEALEGVLQRSPAEATLRFLGKFSPTSGPASAGLSGLGAWQTGGASLPLSGAALVAKALTDRMTKGKLDDALRLIAAGGDKAAAFPAPNALQSLSQSKRDMIAKALIGAGIAYGN